jgi:hypothetical protein
LLVFLFFFFALDACWRANDVHNTVQP